MSKSIQSACWNAVFRAALLSLFVSGGITLWEWLENPGSVFHDVTGTRWGNVWETFQSWLMPLLLSTAAIAVLLVVVWQTFSNYRQK